MNLFFGVLLVIFLILWGIAWRNHTRLAVGILIGICAAWLITSLVTPIELNHVPLWLPPLPFGLVAVLLLGFGIAAWVIGNDSSAQK